MALPKVVIIGRPNVGKSSLFNWLAGRRIAIVDDVSGVTRDRVSTLASIGEGPEARFFELIDTGGVGMVDRDDLSVEVEHQIEIAIERGRSVILFVVDVRDGLMPLDEEVAARLRYLEHAGHPRHQQGRHRTARRSATTNYYKFGRGKPDLRLDPPEPKQEPALEADRSSACPTSTPSSLPTRS